MATTDQYRLRFASTNAVSNDYPGSDRSILLDNIRLAPTAEPPTPTTALAIAPVTSYFRREFTFDGNSEVSDLIVQLLVDDGAVVYLNGSEVARIHMPDGLITHATQAVEMVGGASLSGPVTIPTERLVEGQNVLAVEVHQASAADGDALFGLELTAAFGTADRRVPLPEVAINEVAGREDRDFFVEIVNYGDVPVEVAGLVVALSDRSVASYVIPDRAALAAGEYLAIGQDELGWAAAAGDRLFLFGAGQSTLVDAAGVGVRGRGRERLGEGDWLLTDVPTPGAENQFALRDEIVINEIMYHHRWQAAPFPVPPPPGVLAFDFGPADAPLAAGYVGIGEDPYDAQTGYGWTEGSVHQVDRQVGGNLLRDMVTISNPGATLAADLPNGTYSVAILLGDPSKDRDRVQLRLEPDTAGEVVDEITVAASDYYRATYVVQVTDGQLNVELSDLGGVSTRAVVNALLISPNQITLDASAQEWIELLNRSNHEVDLSGWRLADAIDFTFAPGTTLVAGDCLVVANDAAALAGTYPTIARQIVGNFSRSLSSQDDRIVLVDSVGNPADEVHYYDDGRWPMAAVPALSCGIRVPTTPVPTRGLRAAREPSRNGGHTVTEVLPASHPNRTVPAASMSWFWGSLMKARSCSTTSTSSKTPTERPRSGFRMDHSNTRHSAVRRTNGGSSATTAAGSWPIRPIPVTRCYS